MTHNLFIIDGASGTVKFDLISYLRRISNSDSIRVFPKYTTRKKRTKETAQTLASNLDLQFIFSENFQDYKKNGGKDFAFYTYKENEYGFFKSELAKVIASTQHTFLTIRNLALAKTLKEEFKEINVIHVFIYTDVSKLKDRMEKEHYTPDEIKFRIDRHGIAWEDYLNNYKEYDEVIINTSDRLNFETLIGQLIGKYKEENLGVIAINNSEKYDLPRALLGYRDSCLKKLQSRSFDKNVFLMMKFRPETYWIFELIQKILAEYELNCVRADQQEWRLTNDTYNFIAALFCCKYGIALFNEPEEKNEYSPNVAYELGMMHLQGKECLILIDSSLTLVPFDISKNLHEKYNGKDELSKRIHTWAKTLL